MKIKRIFALLCIMAMSTQTLTAFASEFAVQFDRINKEVVLQGIGSDKNTDFTVTVAKKRDGVLGYDYLPEFISVFKTGEDGSVNIRIKMPDDVKSGKYTVYNDSENYAGKNDIMLVNLSDSDTLDIIEKINDAVKEPDEKALLNILSLPENAEKIGIDTEMSFLSDNIAAISKICYKIGKNTEFDVDSFCSAFDAGAAKVMLSEKSFSVNDVMLKYATYFGTSYDEYVKIKDNIRSKLDSLLKTADFNSIDYSGDLSEIYKELYDEKINVAKITVSENWSYLRDNVLEYADKIGINLNGDYSLISDGNKYKVFVDMFKKISECESYADLKKEFDNAVKNNKNTNQDSQPSGSSGGNGTKKGSASGVSVVGNVIPSEDNKTNISDNTTANKKEFSDMKGHWSGEYVNKLVDMKVISGYEDNTFKPERSVTRAEFVKMLVTLFNIKSDNKSGFDDISEKDWFFESAIAAKGEGIVNGDGNNFMPNKNITRQEAASMIYRLGISKDKSIDISFEDENEIADYAKEAVAELASAGIMNGDGGYVYPSRMIKRGETAALLYRAYCYVNGGTK